MSRWESGTVAGNRRWTEGLHSLRIEAPVDPFIAGQLTRLALDIDGERVARPYSYVNAPHEPVLEFYFNRVPGGRLSNRLSSLSAGDRLWVAPRAACDRHASRLAGASPAMALGRREHVGEGKGARRNSSCTLRKRETAGTLPDGSQ